MKKTLLILALMGVASIFGRAQDAPTESREVFATLQPEKSPLYANAPLSLLLTVSSTIDLDHNFTLRLQPGSKALKLSKFETLGTLPASQSSTGKHTVRRFRVHGSASSSGKLVINLVVNGSTLVRRQNAFGLTTYRRAITFPVDPLSLYILEVPPPPAGLQASGAIGVYDLSVSVHPIDIAPGDLVKITATIKGNGHLGALKAPSTPLSNSFKAYAQEKSSAHTNDTQAVYTQTVIPLTRAAATIPPTVFTYFNTDTSKYLTLRSEAVDLRFHTRVDPIRSVQAATNDTISTQSPLLQNLSGPLSPATVPFDQQLAQLLNSPLAWIALIGPGALLLIIGMLRRRSFMRISGIVALLPLLLLGLGATAPLSTHTQSNLGEARSLYATGNYTEAADIYQTLLTTELPSGITAFNLGTCQLQAGNTAAAIQSYTTAQATIPRHPDLRNNLRLAREVAGLRLSPTWNPYQLPLSLSLDEWLAIGLLLFWALCFIALLGLLTPRALRASLPLVTLLAAAVVTTAVITFIGHGHLAQPLAVLSTSEPWRFSPRTQNDAQAERIPAGHIVKVLENHLHWVRVEFDGNTTWVTPQSLGRIQVTGQL